MSKRRKRYSNLEKINYYQRKRNYANARIKTLKKQQQFKNEDEKLERLNIGTDSDGSLIKDIIKDKHQRK